MDDFSPIILNIYASAVNYAVTVDLKHEVNLCGELNRIFINVPYTDSTAEPKYESPRTRSNVFDMLSWL